MALAMRSARWLLLLGVARFCDNALSTPLLTASNGTTVLRSTRGRGVVLAPGAGGAVTVRALLDAQGGVRLNSTILDSALFTGLKAQVANLTAQNAVFSTQVASLAAQLSNLAAQNAGLILSLDALRPPPCTVPGGDRLQSNGSAWTCVCVAGWSGTSCTTPPSPPPPSPPKPPPSPRPPPPPPSPSPTPPPSPSPPVPLHPLVFAWHGRLTSAGSDASIGVLEAATTFMYALDAANITSSLVRLNLFIGNNMNAAMIPLLVGSGYDADVQSSCSGRGAIPVESGSSCAPFYGTYTPTDSLRVTSGFLSTGQYISHMNLTDDSTRASDGRDLHLGMWFLDAPVLSNFGRPMGVYRFNVWTRHYLLSHFGQIFAWGSQVNLNTPSPTNAGFLLNTGSVSGTTTSYLCAGGSSCTIIGAGQGDGSQPSDHPVGIFNALGSATGMKSETTSSSSSFSIGRAGGYTIGYSLSATQVQAFSSAWSSFMTTIGRS